MPTRLSRRAAIATKSVLYCFLRTLGMTAKGGYRVLFHGDLSGRDGTLKISGFYTTRYVIAGSSEDAIRTAAAAVRQDLRKAGIPDDCAFITEECDRVEQILFTEGGGFSFWQDGD